MLLQYRIEIKKKHFMSTKLYFCMDKLILDVEKFASVSMEYLNEIYVLKHF